MIMLCYGLIQAHPGSFSQLQRAAVTDSQDLAGMLIRVRSHFLCETGDPLIETSSRSNCGVHRLTKGSRDDQNLHDTEGVRRR
jgi:hypothetical protein